MRSRHWEYLAFVLFAVGLALALSGAITYVYFQSHPLVNPQYGGYPIPMLIIGASALLMGALAVWRSRTARTEEAAFDRLMPPPPPPPP